MCRTRIWECGASLVVVSCLLGFILLPVVGVVAEDVGQPSGGVGEVVAGEVEELEQVVD
ncbi:MAG: hypothetical protein GTO53_05835, partial [Planctomycetales bacterium]|nr:hypothetical protein [Planctomycetales bacterium]NIM08664.1 hypothetical protein [Planctomycetales bacterium]NIN08134.1 hypothetical protein [Planctomycetales bacterium]NIN77259.1 hypothetical protein [Planctomycetales bacterium]NIO34448.1 hypothetical protein [Planctomycetales bacterium]